MWWDHDIGWAGSLAMTFGMLGFWAVIALLVLLGVRAYRRPDEQSVAAGLEPRQILERRLAQGEIGLEEFHDRLAAITGSQARAPDADEGAGQRTRPSS